MLTNSRQIAWMFTLIMISTVILPVLHPAPVYAGGPDQPEVKGFTPIGLSDMVDPFTGDFTYNIPLMDVEGYPINIAYHSGVSMDQEASWVGLGWALNVGSINRGMRGLPDDFNGDNIEKTQVTKPTRNIGLDFGVSGELFSVLGVNAGVGVDWNNYNGFATSLSISPSLKLGSFGAFEGTAGFSLSGSSENGASFSPSFSLDKKMKGETNKDNKLNLNIGASMNSRAGLQSISYSASQSKEGVKTVTRTRKDVTTSKASKRSESLGGIGGAFDLGLRTYTPSSGQSMRGVSFAGNVNLGGSVFGIDPSFKIGISYSSNWVPDDLKTIKSPAYGYFNLQNGQSKNNALLDFNRDDDGSFTKYSVNLPTAYLQPDVFSISAQGTSGSFRGFRNDVGYVFDPEVTSVFDAANLSLEFGLGNLTDFGGDVSYNNTSSRSGAWRNMNDAANFISFKNLGMGSYTLQEASESSVDADLMMPSALRGSSPIALKMGGARGPAQAFLKLHSDFISPAGAGSLGQTSRSLRRKTNQAMYFLTVSEYQSSMGVELAPALYSGARPHHIGEITQLGTDGRRYVFGLPAYNHYQEDVTFAIGVGQTGSMGTVNDHEGLISYSPADASVNNSKGLDNYYQSTKTPAYAHSFMLTSVLSDDYTDADAVQGPSIGDLGSYVKFGYTKIDAHKWRTPMQANMAYYNEGLKVDASDDKASYVRGEKDLWYVEIIETKNYVAVFSLEPRKDAYSSAGETGGFDSDDAKAMKCLKKISLYTRSEYKLHENNLSQATPLQEVHFDYSYQLCPGYPGNIAGGGKMTLTKIWFTYQKSNKMNRRSYKFEYNGPNPGYALKASDRWGTYSPLTGTGPENPSLAAYTNSDYPYTTQDKNLADNYAAAWCLTDIILPSGGKISVDYEADDYAYVQHKRASRMFNIVAMGFGDVPDNNPDASQPIGLSPQLQSASSSTQANRQVFFKFDNNDDKIEDYFGKVPSNTSPVQLYFRVLMDFKPGLPTTAKGRMEYVSGYATVANVKVITRGGQKYGAFYMQPAYLKDNNSNPTSQMTKTGILMGRMHMSRFVTDVVNTTLDGNSASQIKDFASSVVNSVGSFKELITGPNKRIYDQGKCQQIMVNKSFIRLFEPDNVKIGGGTRVKRIRMNDNWSSMNAGSTAQNFEYGQEFRYKLEDGSSSGVASYEPQLGGDENPFHTAQIVNNQIRFRPDNNLIIENPIMESQFPSPSVGYSRVEIVDLPRPGVLRTATGKVVKEFFTARDFPTIVSKTEIIAPAVSTNRVKFGPSYSYMDASQGFSIELNDMHGKPKSEQVYANGATAPLSSVKYEYQCEPLNLDGVSNYRLTSSARILKADGTQSNADIGVQYDVTADFRETETKSIGGSMNLNLNVMLFGFFPLPVPIAYPKLNMSHDRFRSATVTKVVQRFGIQTRTVANQDGSVVETKTLSYDAETGDALSSETTTNFNDKVYSLTYPAHWKYPAFGGAYKNIGLKTTLTFNAAGYAAVPAGHVFIEGDELMASTTSGMVRAWITEKTSNTIRVLTRQGAPVSGTVSVKVVRSGYRNKQAVSMASITALSNPENGLISGAYANVLNAGAVDFGDSWQTSCDCISSLSSNPYIIGTKGNYRPTRSFTQLGGRKQSNYDQNTDIRRDGVFTSYSPYYYLNNGKWDVNPSNWTFVSEVTAFSPNGNTLETRDALGRYSATIFDFHQTLTTAVGANMSMKEMAVQSFENPLAVSSCDDNGFLKPSNTWDLSRERAHSGKYSLKVAANASVEVVSKPTNCPVAETCPKPTYDERKRSFSGNFSYDIEIIYGDVYAEMVGSSINFIGDLSQDFEIRITLKSADGCVWHAKFTKGKSHPTLTLLN